MDTTTKKVMSVEEFKMKLERIKVLEEAGILDDNDREKLKNEMLEDIKNT